MKTENPFQETEVVLDRLCQQHEAIALAEQTLREQCQEMGGLLKGLSQKYQATQGQSLAELEVLRMGNECLRQLVAERDQQLAELNQRLTGAPQREPQTGPQLVELNDLRAQLKEKEALVEELRVARQERPAASFVDVADRDYEAELTEFRRQLEADRHGLNEEIQQLRARNAELNEAAREAELQLSRERAQLARERVQLDRLREEIRQELDRVQRNAGVRERLVAVERLKDEVAERHRAPEPGATVPSSSDPRENGSSLARWRSMLSS